MHPLSGFREVKNMGKHIAAVRVQYAEDATYVTPMVRTDRGTRIMAPGAVKVVRQGSKAAHSADVLVALTGMLPETVELQQ